MDIDDILADVSTGRGLGAPESDQMQFTRAWVTEKCAPELLPWPGALIERVMNRIARQVSFWYLLEAFDLGQLRETWVLA